MVRVEKRAIGTRVPGVPGDPSRARGRDMSTLEVAHYYSFYYLPRVHVDPPYRLFPRNVGQGHSLVFCIANTN
eukprot:2632157-Rhodomonas_salina.1